MKIAVLVSQDGGVRVYTDAPAEVIIVDQDCPPDFAEDHHRELVLNPNVPDERWVLSGAFFPHDVGVDPAFVQLIFDEAR